MPGTPTRSTRHTTTSIGKTRAQLRAGGDGPVTDPLSEALAWTGEKAIKLLHMLLPYGL